MTDQQSTPAEKPGKALSKFDPMQHMSKVSGQDYLEVKWRLVWLRSEEPDAVLETNLSFHDGDRAIFYARVTIPSGASATGWGSETANSFGNYIEKAETKAIGRALAALGYGTQFCGDHEDGPESGMLADAPVPARTRNVARSNGSAASVQNANAGVSERQMSLIQALRKDLRLDVQQLDELSVERTGKPVAELNRGQASSLIDGMKDRLASLAGR